MWAPFACRLPLDTCQPIQDCDFNGVFDACDILAMPNFDTNGNGVIDTCEGIFATNMTQSLYYDSVAEAISFADDGDDLVVQVEAFSLEPTIDYLGRAVTLKSVGAVVQPPGGSYVLADDAGLETGGQVGDSMLLSGDLTVSAGARADLVTVSLVSFSPSIIRVRAGGTLLVSSTNIPVLYGHLQLDAGATVVFDNILALEATGTVHGILAAPTIWIDGSLEFYGGTLEADSLEIGNKPGVLQGYGDIFGNLVNYINGNAIFVADTQIVGDFTNQGVTTIQNGVLTVLGTLTNNGTIIGDFAGRGSAMASSDAAADGFFVKSDFDLGRNSTLVMPSPSAVVRVGGNFGAATSDRERFDMANAELRMVGLGGVQSMEIMSTDIGAAPRGLSRDHSGHYPLGTLRIGPTPTIVSLIDSHDNDQLGQTMQEAVYASELIVDAGARLETNGHLIYFVSSTVLGTVDDMSNLVPIVFLPGDMDGSGGLGLADYASFWECFEDSGSCLPGIFELADVNDDGQVNLADFAQIQEAFTGSNTP